MWVSKCRNIHLPLDFHCHLGNNQSNGHTAIIWEVSRLNLSHMGLTHLIPAMGDVLVIPRKTGNSYPLHGTRVSVWCIKPLHWTYVPVCVRDRITGLLCLCHTWEVSGVKIASAFITSVLLSSSLFLYSTLQHLTYCLCLCSFIYKYHPLPFTWSSAP